MNTKKNILFLVLVGAPPGYVGYDEGGQLTEAVRRKPYSVVLLDEIEKAHPDVFNTLLQVLDDGRLTDNKGRVVNFKNTLVIMTSNIGAHLIQNNFEKITDKNRTKIIEKTKTEVFEELKNSVRPEFLNRIDETILFLPLSRKDVRDIVKIQLKGLESKLAKNEITFDSTPAGLDWIADLGYDPQYGARPIKRVVQRKILNALSKEILSGRINHGDHVLLDQKDGEVVFRTNS